jgi:hypothetical protein
MIRQIALTLILACCGGFLYAQQPVANGQPPLAAAGLTSTTCPGSGCLTVGTSGQGVATVTVHGTYAGATIAFNFSDDGGTTYYQEQCERTDVAIQETGEVLPSNQTRSWDCGVYATSNFQVSLSAITTGTATVGITLSAASIEPALSVTPANSPWAQNLTQVDGTALGAPSAYGTAPGAVNVPGVNAYVTNTPPVSQSGTWNVRITGNAGGVVDTTAGGTAAANSVQAGGVYNSSAPTPSSGQQEPLQLDSAANLLVNLKTAIPAGSNNIGGVNLAQLGGSSVYADPCLVNTPSAYVVNFATTTTTTMITGTSSKKTYLCGVFLIAGAATNINIVEGTGTNCSTISAGMIGGSTAATGANLAANGGFVMFSGGYWVAVTATAADNVCFMASAANQVSGVIKYVQQ